MKFGDGSNEDGVADPDVFVESTDGTGKNIRAFNMDTVYPEGTGQGFLVLIDLDDDRTSLLLTQNEMLDLGMQLLAAAGTPVTEEPVEGEPNIYVQTATVIQVRIPA